MQQEHQTQAAAQSVHPSGMSGKDSEQNRGSSISAAALDRVSSVQSDETPANDAEVALLTMLLRVATQVGHAGWVKHASDQLREGRDEGVLASCMLEKDENGRDGSEYSLMLWKCTMDNITHGDDRSEPLASLGTTGPSHWLA